ncbi:FAS1-like dehydratase domain-containing protein [Halovivax limisalsi]|uniref:FAS1-like dehydratase domain-containing protein n=1 Tax=Halovivax limisalsi TaxID=1453760 RepID=UPI001FFC8F0B|nr:MaoC family dehydratase N-terminal domain-containing protein [Halovivax limisalsi]
MTYFEEYDVGMTYRTNGRTITESAIESFVELCGLYEPMFTDIEHVREHTPYDERFAPGELVTDFALGNVIRSGFIEEAMTMLELHTTFEKPVFAGDTISVEITVRDTTERSDPESGIVTFEYDIRNQDDETVATTTETVMIRRRPAE